MHFESTKNPLPLGEVAAAKREPDRASIKKKAAGEGSRFAAT